MGISKKQLQILTFGYKKYDALICDGAIRTGKTSLMSIAFIDWAMLNFRNQNFAICSKTVGTALKNVVEPYMATDYAKERYSMRLKRGENVMIVTNSKNITNNFYIYGGKDASSYALIQGITLAGVFLDEVALMVKSFVEQALARCSIDGSKYWFNCNPASPKHWFYEEWIRGRTDKNVLYLHFLLDDNPSLTDKIKTRYSNNFTGVFHDRYIKGLWVNAEGLIYKEFADAVRKESASRQEYFISKEQAIAMKQDFVYINIGLDFGGNKSNHALNATAITKDWKLVCLKSDSFSAKEVRVDKLISHVNKFCEEIRQTYGEADGLYCDSAEQTLINTIRASTDLNVYNSIKNVILDRIRTTELLMANNRIVFVEEDTEDLLNGLTSCVWDDKSDDDKRLDNGTSDIDIMDSFEYSWEFYIKYLSD